jgi:hypothetical protein
MTEEQQNAVLESIKTTMGNARTVQKQRIGENVQVVVQALKKIEADIKARYDETGKAIEKRVANIKDGRDGQDGVDGRAGKDGRPGRDGATGPRGIDGLNGSNGIDGEDGISITDAHIDFDGSLIITLSDGKLLNVGEVVSQDIAEKINVISTMSTNASLTIEDEGSSISGAVRTINFVGAAVTASASGDEVTVNVSSGTGTVTSVAATGGTGISVSGSPITTSGTLTITNTAPDQTVALTQGGTTTITGTYPNFTISSTDQFVGTVTSVTGTSPVVSSGGTTPAISLASGYGDTLNPYASKTANFVLAAPDGTAGVPTFRAVVAADIPTLNQNTTGNAATATTATNQSGGTVSATSIAYSTTLTGGTGIVNLGSGQFYKDATGNVGIGTSLPGNNLTVQGTTATSSGIDLVTTANAAGDGPLISFGRNSISNTIGNIRGGRESSGGFLAISTVPAAGGSAVEAMRIDNAGTVDLAATSGLSIGRTAVTGTPATTDGNVFSGTYTPTQVSTNTNVAAVTYSACQYMRVGNTVTVSGQISIDPTTAATDTTVKMSPPIASNFTSSRQVGGAGLSTGGVSYATQAAMFFADITNDCVEIRLNPVSASAVAYAFSFTYQVI